MTNKERVIVGKHMMLYQKAPKTLEGINSLLRLKDIKLKELKKLPPDISPWAFFYHEENVWSHYETTIFRFLPLMKLGLKHG